MQQEVVDDISIFCWISPPKVRSLPSLLAVKLSKSEDKDFSNDHFTSRWSLYQRNMFESLLHEVNTLSSLVSIHLLQVEIRILFVSWPHQTTPRIFMGESSSQQATTLKSLVTIGILMVKRKNVSSNTWIL